MEVEGGFGQHRPGNGVSVSPPLLHVSSSVGAAGGLGGLATGELPEDVNEEDDVPDDSFAVPLGPASPNLTGGLATRVTPLLGQALPSPRSVPVVGPRGAPDLRQHLMAEHGLTHSEYRRKVLGQVMAEWPQPVRAQTLRTCLASFKQELCDTNFRILACASCARQKRQVKLTRVSFPPVASHAPPSWLQ